MMTTTKKFAAAAIAVAFAFGLTLATHADDNAPTSRLTFTKDILPILQENCQTCHRAAGTKLSGMIAPMALTTYQEVRPWAKSIASSVSVRQMPPWDASPKFHGVFANERTLAQEQIDTIVAWVKSGAPRGRAEDAPNPLVFPDDDGWVKGKPDLIVDFPEPYFVGDDVEDLYINFEVELTEEQLTEDHWVETVQFRPGSQVVHHIMGYARPPKTAAVSDQGVRGLMGGMAPGTDPQQFPAGFGRLLRKGSTVRFGMHYHKESGPGTGMLDSSQIGFTFSKEPVKHEVTMEAIGNLVFEVPPGHPNWQVGAAKTFEEDTTILALFPHMHLRGKAAKYVAFYPDGTQETLLEVPEYDFNWQTNYVMKEPKKVPAGTRIEVFMWFDNTSERSSYTNIDWKRPVRFGGPTTDEMMLGWIDYAPTEEKDLSLLISK